MATLAAQAQWASTLHIMSKVGEKTILSARKSAFSHWKNELVFNGP